MNVYKSVVVVFLLQALPTSAVAKPVGLPQLDPTWFANQLLWLAVSFTLLYQIVARVIIPRVHGVLSLRQATIDTAIAKAEDFKKNAGAARSDFEHRAHEVQAKANAVLAEAQARAARASADALAKLSVELEAREALAMSGLKQSLKAAEADMQQATSEVAHAIAEKLLGVRVDGTAVAKALKKVA